VSSQRNRAQSRATSAQLTRRRAHVADQVICGLKKKQWQDHEKCNNYSILLLFTKNLWQ
jgi:FixJ family two-component response regulator